MDDKLMIARGLAEMVLLDAVDTDTGDLYEMVEMIAPDLARIPNEKNFLEVVDIFRKIMHTELEEFQYTTKMLRDFNADGEENN